MQDPQFGNVLLTNRLSEDLNVTKDEENKLLKRNDILQISTPMGKNRFRFYLASSLLLDTTLSVQPYEINKYTLFKPTRGANLVVLDDGFNSFKSEALPDPGFVKVSLANFSESLPDKVNIDVFTTTYTPFSLKTIQVGQMLSVSSSFSAYQTMLIGIDQSSRQINVFTLSIKDPVNNSVLATIPLTLPYASNTDIHNNFAAAVYLVYLNEQSVPSILMSK